MTLATSEFIRRFLLHVVPPGFMRIRHCVFMSCRARPAALERLRTVFKSIKPYVPVKDRPKKLWHEIVEEKTGRDPGVCPYCKVGIMRNVRFSMLTITTRAVEKNSIMTEMRYKPCAVDYNAIQITETSREKTDFIMCTICMP